MDSRALETLYRISSLIGKAEDPRTALRAILTEIIAAFGAASGPAGATLLVTTNVYGGSTTYLMTEPGGALTPIDVPGTLNNEAIVVDRDGALALFGDIDAEISGRHGRQRLLLGFHDIGQRGVARFIQT